MTENRVTPAPLASSRAVIAARSVCTVWAALPSTRPSAVPHLGVLHRGGVGGLVGPLADGDLQVPRRCAMVTRPVTVNDILDGHVALDGEASIGSAA
jgi:hypothetical protein